MNGTQGTKIKIHAGKVLPSGEVEASFVWPWPSPALVGGEYRISLEPPTVPTPDEPATPDLTELRARVEGALRRSFDRASEEDGRLIDAHDAMVDLLDTVISAVDKTILRAAPTTRAIEPKAAAQTGA